MFNNQKFFNEIFTNGDDYIEICKNISKEIFENNKKSNEKIIEEICDIESGNYGNIFEVKKDMENLKKINIKIFTSNGEIKGKIHINKSIEIESKVLDSYIGVGGVIPYFYNKDNKIVDIIVHKSFFKYEYRNLLTFLLYHELSHFMIEKNIGISNINYDDEIEYEKEFLENFNNFLKCHKIRDKDLYIPETQIINLKREIIANALTIYVLEKRFSINYDYFYNIYKNFGYLMVWGMIDFNSLDENITNLWNKIMKKVNKLVLKCYKKIANINSNKFLFHFEFEEEGSGLEFLSKLDKKQQMEDFFTVIA